MILHGQMKATKIGKTWIIEETEVIRIAKTARKAGRPRKK